jgi:hypothetical protein
MPVLAPEEQLADETAFDPNRADRKSASVGSSPTSHGRIQEAGAASGSSRPVAAIPSGSFRRRRRRQTVRRQP